MKLSYRGVDYDYNPPVLEVTETEILCQFRGRSHPYRYVRHVPFRQPAVQLTYRGVAYQTTRHGEAVQMSQPAARTSVFATLRGKLEALNPMVEARRRLLHEAAVAHQSSMRRTLQHRIDVARAQGNSGLLRQLEDEMQQMA